jgi:hypothetical protein
MITNLQAVLWQILQRQLTPVPWKTRNRANFPSLS